MLLHLQERAVMQPNDIVGYKKKNHQALRKLAQSK